MKITVDIPDELVKQFDQAMTQYPAGGGPKDLAQYARKREAIFHALVERVDLGAMLLTTAAIAAESDARNDAVFWETRAAELAANQ